MSWSSRLSNHFRERRVERDIARELRFHIAERADELAASGMSREEALHTARKQFGSLAAHAERTRDIDMARWLDSAARNFRLALRTLAKAPLFSATVVITLALGIGANSGVFSAIYAVLLRPLPFPDPDQLVLLRQISARNPNSFVAPVRLTDWSRLNSTFQAISGYYMQDDSELSGELPEKVRRAFVAPRFLEVWGVAPAIGRSFTTQEERFGGPMVIVISDRYWRRRFAADPSVLGKTLRFGSSSWTIIGVMPSSFLFPDRDVDAWSTSPMDAPYAQDRSSTWFTVIGRMKPGVNVQQARANLAAIQSNLGKQFPKTDAELTVNIEPLKETTVGGVRRSLWLLFGSVSILLLIACTNIAALLVSRSTQRRHEISVRFSLGASRAAVAGQLLTEAFVLALAGALLGLLIAAGSAGIFRSLARDLPRVEEIRLDGRVVIYSLVCAVAATLICGWLPAIWATRRDLVDSLARASRGQVSGRNPIQLVLVGVQVALAVTLLAGAGLLLRSFQELGRVSPGFDIEHVLTFHVSSSWGETVDLKASAQRTARILDTLRSIPGIQAAAVSMSLPGGHDDFPLGLEIDGRSETEPKVAAESRFLSHTYFETLQIPLLAGGLCSEDSQQVGVLVNLAFANSYFQGMSPIGHHLRAPGSFDHRSAEIRGIVGDVRETGLDRPAGPAVYWCYQSMQPGMYFLVRTRSEPLSMAETIRRKIHEIEPQRSVYDVTPLAAHISDAFAENRLRAILLSFFAFTAVSLACVGLYGTLSYLVTVRQREIGLRLALGAVRGQILGHFLGRGMAVSLLGCMAGLALAVATSRLLAGMLYGVSPLDPVTLAGVPAAVLGVAAFASLAPAVRASRLDPTQVLREE